MRSAKTLIRLRESLSLRSCTSLTVGFVVLQCLLSFSMHKSFVLGKWILVLVVFVASRWWILLSRFVIFVSYWCVRLVVSDIVIPDIVIHPLALVSWLFYFSLVCSLCAFICRLKGHRFCKLSKHQGSLFFGLKDLWAIESLLYFASRQTCMCIKMYHSQTGWYSTPEKIFYPKYPDF